MSNGSLRSQLVEEMARMFMATQLEDAGVDTDWQLFIPDAEAALNIVCKSKGSGSIWWCEEHKLGSSSPECRYRYSRMRTCRMVESVVVPIPAEEET